jgi:hypothetical protein
METMSNVQGAGSEVAIELSDKMIGEATDIVYEAARALVRFGRQQPLFVAGLAAAAAVAYAFLKPAARRSVRAAASDFASSLGKIAVAGGAPAAKRRSARGGGTKRAGRGQRSAPRNGRQAHA